MGARMRQIILASGSPRRKELLLQIGLPFTAMPCEKEETIREKSPEKIVEQLSYDKAMEAAGRAPEGSLVIGADTMVALDGEAMGKPRDEAQAAAMLERLAGRSHQVYTGVTAVIREGEDYEFFTFHEKTQVHIYPMTPQEIREYAASGEPMDKAGAYAVQGLFAKYVRGIEGDYNNVVGLPVSRLWQELKKRGLCPGGRKDA